MWSRTLPPGIARKGVSTRPLIQRDSVEIKSSSCKTSMPNSLNTQMVTAHELQQCRTKIESLETEISNFRREAQARHDELKQVIKNQEVNQTPLSKTSLQHSIAYF